MSEKDFYQENEDWMDEMEDGFWDTDEADQECLGGFICEEGNCMCDKNETYNNLCDKFVDGTISIIEATKLTDLHDELFGDDYPDDICLVKEGI